MEGERHWRGAYSEAQGVEGGAHCDASGEDPEADSEPHYQSHDCPCIAHLVWVISREIWLEAIALSLSSARTSLTAR